MQTGVAFAPEDAVSDEDNVVLWEEFEECVNAIHQGKAPGWDETPVEAYVSSPSAKQELYEIVCIMWKKEEIPPDLVRAIFIKAHVMTSVTIARSDSYATHTRSWLFLHCAACSMPSNSACQIHKSASGRRAAAETMRESCGRSWTLY